MISKDCTEIEVSSRDVRYRLAIASDCRWKPEPMTLDLDSFSVRYNSGLVYIYL